ncbi:MAG: DedA family protein, partial [Calditrichaeota bacterium]|nr:DedA family protein [Calditrichota bacterium]
MMPAGSIWALFSNSFLAATILPIGSEPLLIYLLGQGMDPWQLLLWASLGNIAGAMVNYLLGRLGSEPLFRKVLRMSPEEV